MDRRTLIFLASVLIIALAFGSMFLGNPVLTFNIISWGGIIVVIPLAIYTYLDFKRIKEMEEQMAAFLRDLSESIHSGLSLVEALRRSAENNYGPLTAELKKVANSLDWGLKLEDALERMRKRLKRSDKIDKILSIIIEVNRSGGEMYKILYDLSRDVEKLKTIEQEKKTLLGRHVLMIYAIHIIFILIVVLLLRFLAPILSTEAEELQIGLIQFGQDPCRSAAGLGDLACSIFKGTVAVAGFPAEKQVIAYYKGLMFWMIMMQGIFAGLVAGFIESNSLESAFKHSVILSLIGFLSFYLANIVGII